MEKLKALIDKKYESRAEFAKEIGVSPSVLSRMLASGNWKVDRIETAVKVLKIPTREIPSYFFTTGVAKNGTEREER